MANESKNERDVMRIMIWGSAISFGFMAATLQALRPNTAGFTLKLSSLTVGAFLAGLAIALVFWKIILNRSPDRKQRTLRVAAELLLLVIGAAAFLYPLRFVPAEKLPDMITGLVSAAIALSLLAGLLIMVGRFLEADDKKNSINSEDNLPSKDKVIKSAESH